MAGRCCYGFSVFLAFAALIATATLHVLAWYDKGQELDLYEENMEKIWSGNDLEVIHTGWLIYIWVAVYAYQAIWLIYAFTAPFRKTKTGYLGAHPPVMPPSIYITFLFVMGAIIGWLVLWAMFEYAVYSILLIMAAGVFSSLTLCISVYATKKHGDELEEEGHGGTLWSIRIFMQNGLGALSAWSIIYIFYIMDVLLTRSGLASKETSGFATMGIIMGYMLIWLFLDIIVTREPMAFLFTPYVMVIMAFAMAVEKNRSDIGMQFYISVLFLVLTAILTLLKIALSAGRYSRKNVGKDDESFGAVSYEENHGSESSVQDDDDLGNLEHLSDQLYVIS